MVNKTWGDIEKEYREYGEICERHEINVEDIEAEIDGSVDDWVSQSDAAKVIISLEHQLKVMEEALSSLAFLSITHPHLWNDKVAKVFNENL